MQTIKRFVSVITGATIAVFGVAILVQATGDRFNSSSDNSPLESKNHTTREQEKDVSVAKVIDDVSKTDQEKDLQKVLVNCNVVDDPKTYLEYMINLESKKTEVVNCYSSANKEVKDVSDVLSEVTSER